MNMNGPDGTSDDVLHQFEPATPGFPPGLKSPVLYQVELPAHPSGEERPGRDFRCTYVHWSSNPGRNRDRVS